MYSCHATRSNYFKVKDNKKFTDFMKHVYGFYNEPVNMFVEERIDGTYFAFGCFSTIVGYMNKNPFDAEPDVFDEAYDAFLNGLQNHVTDGEAIIITEIGYIEGKDVYGYVLVVTKDGCRSINTREIGCDIAKSMLHNDSFETNFNF